MEKIRLITLEEVDKIIYKVLKHIHDTLEFKCKRTKAKMINDHQAIIKIKLEDICCAVHAAVAVKSIVCAIRPYIDDSKDILVPVSDIQFKINIFQTMEPLKATDKIDMGLEFMANHN